MKHLKRWLIKKNDNNSNEAPSTDVKSNENPNDGTSKDGKSNGRITYSR